MSILITLSLTASVGAAFCSYSLIFFTPAAFIAIYLGYKAIKNIIFKLNK